MSWVTDLRILGGRDQYNRRRQMVQTLRQIIVAECLRAGITNKKEIQAIVRERRPVYPSSVSTIKRDIGDLQELWETEGRCDKCGHRLAPLTANEGEGSEGMVMQDGDERQ